MNLRGYEYSVASTGLVIFPLGGCSFFFSQSPDNKASSMSRMFSSPPPLRGTIHQQTWLCMCVSIHDPCLSSHKRLWNSVTHLALWANRRTPMWKLKHWITHLVPDLPLPLHFAGLSLLPSELGQAITCLGVCNIRVCPLSGLHLAQTRSCHIPSSCSLPS